MTHREPPSVAILSARIMRAYPSLSPYSVASLATELESIERAQRRHATRQCNGPREAKGDVPGYFRLQASGYVKGERAVWVHDPDAEQRAGERIERRVAMFWKRLASFFPNNAYSLGLDDVRPFKLLTGPGWKDVVSEARIELQGDPRGCVLLLRLPNEAEASGV